MFSKAMMAVSALLVSGTVFAAPGRIVRRLPIPARFAVPLFAKPTMQQEFASKLRVL